MRALVRIGLIALCAALIWWALSQGLTETTLAQRLAALWPGDSVDPAAARIEALRLPRIYVSLLAGAMIAASGVILQCVARNGLADPGLLGVSQGGVLAILAGIVLFDLSESALVPLGLFGALTTAGAVLLIARRSLSGGGLILVGIAVNILLGSVTELITTSGDMARFARLAVWSRGSLAGASGQDVTLIGTWAIGLLPLALIAARWLGPLSVGEDLARVIGIDTRLAVPLLVVLAAALAAPVVAVCGPISFLGLIAGHVARRLVGGRMADILPAAMLLGAAVLLVADTLGRSLFQPMVIPAGIVTSVGGFLVFILAARLGRRTRNT